VLTRIKLGLAASRIVVKMVANYFIR
jgi:hypothetical protein